MADCECLPGCPFFNDRMKDQGGMAGLYKKKYCLGSNAECARYIVFGKLGKGTVPGDLYPNMLERAHRIVEQARPGFA